MGLVLLLAGGSQLAAAFIGLASGLCFLSGSTAFMVDAGQHVVKDRWLSSESNAYLQGSYAFWMGAVFLTAGSSYLIASFFRPPLFVKVPHIMNMIGSMFFLLGSLFFLVLGFWEMQTFQQASGEPGLPHLQRRVARCYGADCQH